MAGSRVYMPLQIRKKFISAVSIVLIIGLLIPILPRSTFATLNEPDPDSSVSEPSKPASEPFDDTIPPGENVAPIPIEDNVLPVDKVPLAFAPSKIAQKFDTTRIVLNASDKRDLEQYYAVSKALPDLESDLIEFASLTGKSVEELTEMYEKDYKSFASLQTDTENKYFNNEYIKKRLISSPEILSEVLGAPIQTVTESIKDEPDVISAEISDILQYQFDRKVIQTLIYLITPKNLGGAGHWKVRVYRLRKNYDRENNKWSRESEVAEEQEKTKGEREDQTIEEYKSRQETKDLNNLLTNSGYDDSGILAGGTINDGGGNLSDFLIATDEHSSIISAHAKGQAIDISELDDFRCTVVKKRRVGGDQKTPQAPSPLKLQWQTKEGYGADKQRIDSSFNDMFLNMSQDAIIEMLSGIDIDFETLENMDAASFSDIASVIGQAFLSNAINSPSSEIWKFDLEETLRKLGGVILADKLSLDRQPFIDTDVKSVEALTSAIGRYAIEKKLELPYGSLAGNSRDEILIRIGKTRLADELHLPTDVFDMPATTEDELYQNIGSRLIEEDLGFPTGSFNKNTLAEVRDAVGKYKLDAMFKFPSGMDSYLGLPDGTTEKLKNGGINVREYNRLVAEMHLNNFAFVYPQASGGTNLRDEMFNLPEGTIAKLLAVTIGEGDYKRIGIYSLARSLETSDEMRCSLEEWLRNPNPEFRSVKCSIPAGGTGYQPTSETLYLPRTVYASALGIDIDQVYRVLGSSHLGDASAVYKRLGERILIEAIKNSSMLERRINDFIINNPQIGQLIEEFEFYYTRIENIKNLIQEFNARSGEVQALLSQINDPTVVTARQQAVVSLSELASSIQTLSKNEANASNILDIISSIVQNVYENAQRVASDINQFDSIPASRENAQLLTAINALNLSVEGIAKNAYEIVSGKEQNDFRIEDLSISQLAEGTTGDLILLLSGKISVTDYLVYQGSKKLGEELNLPPKALKYAALVINHFIKGDSSLKDAFFRGIGLAQFEEDAGIGTAMPSIDTGALGGGITIQQLRSQLATTTGYTQSRVDDIITGAFGLKGYNLESLIRGDFGAWSTAKAKAEENDRKSKMPIGTTESFIRGKALGEFDRSTLSADSIRQLSTRMNISEPAIETFLAARDGEENPAINAIYFVDHNQYRSNRDTDANGQGQEECIARDVPDNSYLYYDRDGLHSFNSYAAANEYRRAHADRELSYIEELSLGLVEVMVQTQVIRADDQAERNRYFEQFKSQISDFISSDKSEIDGYSDIRMRMVDILGFSPDTVSGLFTRSVSVGGDKVPIDFLKIYGYSMLEHFAVSYLNSYLDISFGSARLTADDFYEIMNGNARSVFARVGGAMLDEELGLERGTIREILESTDSAQRKCSMERAAMQLLGDFLNIPGLKLDGSIFDNFGGGKIERLLGFPEKSFKGKTLDELIDNVGELNFIKGFRVPVSSVAQKSADDTLKGISQDYYDTHKSKDFYGKAEAINIYFDSLGKEGLQTTWENLFGWININTEIGQSVNMIKNATDSDLWGVDEGAAVFYIKNYLNIGPDDYNYSDAELSNLFRTFTGRLDSIDANLMLDRGTTKGLLSGKISPDEYRKKTSDKALLGIGVDLLLDAFGLRGTGIDSGRINEFINAIKHLGNNSGAMFDPYNNSTPASIIYSFLTDLFSFNLDQLAHFSQGTIEKLLVNPERALPVILREGAIMLDRQLGLGGNIDSSGNPMGAGYPSLLKYASLSAVVDALYGTEADYEFCTDQSYPNGAYPSYSECMNQRRHASIENAIRDNAVTAINDLLEKIKIRVGVNQADGSIVVEDQNLGIRLPVDKLKMIFEGDMRPIAIISIAMGLEQIFGDSNGAYAPNETLRFTVEDIIAAFYGDPVTEAAARARAEAYIYANENGTNGYTEADPPADPPPYLPRGSQVSGSTSSQPRVAQTVSDLTIGVIEEMYPVSAGANTTAPVDPGQFDWSAEPDPSDSKYWDNGVFNSEKYQADYAAFQQSYFDWNQKNHDYWLLHSEAQEAGDQAVADARRVFMEQLQYRISDCLLQKLDPRIPAGFTWAMYKGSDFVRTTYILAYLENWMHDAGFFDFLPKEFQDLNLANPIYAFLYGDPTVKGNWDALVAKTGVLDALDQFLVNRSPVIMGMSLEKGTAGAIYAFIKTGSTSQDYQGLKSLSSIYSTDWIAGKLCAWADKALGLPSGTMGQMYGFYKQFRAIQMISRYSDVGKLSQALGEAGLSDFGIIDQYSQYLSSTPSGEQLDFDAWKKSKVDGLKADLYAAAITFIIQTVFAKQIASFEQMLGLVPGSGGLLVTMAVSAIFGVALTVPLIMFVALNLFGFYKTEYLCTPDGYYPKLESPPDPGIWDVSGIGHFDALKPKIREAKYIESAQYKANRLIGDLLEMPVKKEDEKLVPTQIMTGRREDVWAWAPYIQGICDKVGGKPKDGLCSGTKAGIWANPQTTSYTHIGF